MYGRVPRLLPRWCFCLLAGVWFTAASLGQTAYMYYWLEPDAGCKTVVQFELWRSSVFLTNLVAYIDVPGAGPYVMYGDADKPFKAKVVATSPVGQNEGWNWLNYSEIWVQWESATFPSEDFPSSFPLAFGNCEGPVTDCTFRLVLANETGRTQYYTPTTNGVAMAAGKSGPILPGGFWSFELTVPCADKPIMGWTREFLDENGDFQKETSDPIMPDSGNWGPADDPPEPGPVTDGGGDTVPPRDVGTNGIPWLDTEDLAKEATLRKGFDVLHDDTARGFRDVNENLRAANKNLVAIKGGVSDAVSALTTNRLLLEQLTQGVSTNAGTYGVLTNGLDLATRAGQLVAGTNNLGGVPSGSEGNVLHIPVTVGASSWTVSADPADHSIFASWAPYLKDLLRWAAAIGYWLLGLKTIQIYTVAGTHVTGSSKTVPGTGLAAAVLVIGSVAATLAVYSGSAGVLAGMAGSIPTPGTSAWSAAWYLVNYFVPVQTLLGLLVLFLGQSAICWVVYMGCAYVTKSVESA